MRAVVHNKSDIFAFFKLHHFDYNKRKSHCKKKTNKRSQNEIFIKENHFKKTKQNANSILEAIFF